MQPIFGEGKATAELLELMKKIAPTDVSIFVQGESGSGKEVLARQIHEMSERSGKAFVAVNCGAIPRDLLESELFGHVKGAFTGAIADRQGKIVAANGGTLFLDEIGDMPLEMQVKLLRVVQERVVDPVGSNSSVEIDVRVISATHRSIEDHISQGKFRADLFFRLNVVPLYLPPLRERIEEIPKFIDYFSSLYSEDNDPVALEDSFVRAIMNYDWPGNIRELSNFIQRISVLFPGESVGLNLIPQRMLPVGLQHLVDQQVGEVDDDRPKMVGDDSYMEIVMSAKGLSAIGDSNLSLKETLNSLEKEMIRRVLDEVDGNVSMCARILKVQRTTLIERIRKYSLS
ncbi:MAG: sigma-54-dependent Fis family transcriptional regulator [Gammaproteobacteria bacterium]|nr:sigma-54-dependent Fis family transcriptional regulator [Gammaproteobacteria bacterium]